MGDLGPLKKIWHPEYGNYGGYYNRCRNKAAGVCKRPIDWLDGVFKDHDNGDSNRTLVKKLWAGRGRLFQLKVPVYGQAYWLGALLVFLIPALLNI